MTHQIQHPAYTENASRGKPATAPTGESIGDEGYFEVPDEDAAIAMMDQLAATYGVEYDGEGAVVTDAALARAGVDVAWDPRVVEGVGDTLAGRIAERNETVADILTGTDDQQPEDVLAEIDGVDRDLAGDITQMALDAGSEDVSEASIDVLAPGDADADTDADAGTDADANANTSSGSGSEE